MRRDLTVAVLLAVATLTIYGQLVHYDFVNFDDGKYVYENPRVQSGLSRSGIVWAFTTLWASNWHPLTWLSHMLDCELFGLNAGYHHLVSVFLHILNSLLLYVILRRMTKRAWRSGMVAALFALHPLHVESVAWISERKDVLSTLFFMLTLWAYGRYAERPSSRRYVPVFGFLALGLMAKPMLVTVPFVLLLLDYWPLRRLPSLEKAKPPSTKRPFHKWRNSPGSAVLRMIIEKVPLLALVAASCAVTFVAQQRGGAVASTLVIPQDVRVTNALVSYVVYITKTLWPSRLAVFYPYQDSIPTMQAAGAFVVLVGVSAFIVWASRRWRYLAVGWFWYLGTLVPVIGLVQVGQQAMADRYTYIPLIGIFMLAVWSVADLVAGWRHRRIVSVALAGMVIVACMVVTYSQVQHWRNGVSLFEHSLMATTPNAVAAQNLGNALHKQGKLDEAIEHYEEAIGLDPRAFRTYNYLGLALMEQGKLDASRMRFLEALRIHPDLKEAHLNLGIVFAKQGKHEESIHHYREALRIQPEYTEAHNNLGFMLAQQGKHKEATTHYGEALRIDPEYARAHFNLGLTLLAEGRLDDCSKQLLEALRCNPRYAEAHHSLGVVLAQQGKWNEAVPCFREAIRLDSKCSAFHSSLALALATNGEIDDAIRHYREAIRLQPQDPGPYNNLAWIRATHPDPRFRDGREAVPLAEKACEFSEQKDPYLLDTLAAAHAEAGRFSDAITTAEKALSLAASAAASQLVLELEKRLQGYRVGKPYRDTLVLRRNGEPYTKEDRDDL